MQKIKFSVGLAALCLLLLCVWQGLDGLVPIAHAAPTFPDGTDTQIADLVGKIILVMDMLTWICFVALSYLLDPQFIFGGSGGNLMTVLNSIWQLARDLMNVIFALILVGAAIYTIVTAKKEFLSQYAPKFIAAVILVNFSWFLPRVVLDVANVATATVYGIPSLLSTAPGGRCQYIRTVTPPATPPANLNCDATDNPEGSGRFACPCMGVTDAQFFVEPTELATYRASGYSCPLETIFCFKQSVLDFATVAPQSAVLNGLIINHARLAMLATVPESAPAGTGSAAMLQFLMKLAVVLLIHIALVFPLLAMTIAFFIRIPVLWITMAFMPFYFLDFLAGGQISQYTHDMPKQILTYFLKAAFLPMMVAVPFSIGLLLLNAATQIEGGDIATVSFRIFDQVNNFWQLIWLGMSLGVIWVGVFTILEGDRILGAGSRKIQDFGQTLGSIALKAPLSIPTIPGTNMSYLGALTRAHPRNISSALSSGTRLGEIGNVVSGNAPPSPQARTAMAELRRTGAVAQLVKLANEIINDPEDAKRTHERIHSIDRITTQNGGIRVTPSNIHTVLEDLHRAGLHELSVANIHNIQSIVAKHEKAAPPAPPPPAK